MNIHSHDHKKVIGVLPTCDAVGLQGQHNSTSWERRFHCRISGCPNNGGRGYLRSTILGHFNNSHSQEIRSNPTEKAKAMTTAKARGGAIGAVTVVGNLVYEQIRITPALNATNSVSPPPIPGSSTKRRKRKLDPVSNK